jgi:hypothetical protein
MGIWAWNWIERGGGRGGVGHTFLKPNILTIMKHLDSLSFSLSLFLFISPSTFWFRSETLLTAFFQSHMGKERNGWAHLNSQKYSCKK